MAEIKTNAFIGLVRGRCLASLVILFFLMVMVGEGLSQSKMNKAAYEQAFNTAVKTKDYKAAMQNALALAEVNQNERNFEKSIDWFFEVVRYAEQLKDYKNQFEGYYGIGAANTGLKNLRKAAEAFEKCITAAGRAADKANEISGNLNLAKTEEAYGRNKRTIAPLERALTLATSLENEQVQLECYLSLAKNHLKLGNTEQAEFYQNLYKQTISTRQNLVSDRAKMGKLKQRIVQVETEKQMTEAMLLEEELKLRQSEDSLRQAEALNRERELQINLLSKDKEISAIKMREQNAELQNERLWRYFIMAGAVMAGVLVVVIILYYRSRLQANKKIHKQNENIRSSIKYASRIQGAMLPKDQKLNEHAPESFVLFKPRDTVSGDFYWFTEIKNGSAGKDLAFAAVDCTGHGVPGAFMSMIGMNSLNGIVSRGITHSNEILSSLHSEIRGSLRQQETGNNDGMDIALCIYRKEKKTIEFSGAKNPLVYIQNNELHQIKGDIHPIGGSKSKPDIAYKKHEFCVNQPTMIYLFSDGYRDQFGGKDNSKFMSKRFTKLLFDIHQYPMEKQQALLDIALEEWKGNSQQTDDILVMGIKLGVN